jgi:hypothetical protein
MAADEPYQRVDDRREHEIDATLVGRLLNDRHCHRSACAAAAAMPPIPAHTSAARPVLAAAAVLCPQRPRGHAAARPVH